MSSRSATSSLPSRCTVRRDASASGVRSSRSGSSSQSTSVNPSASCSSTSRARARPTTATEMPEPVSARCTILVRVATGYRSTSRGDSVSGARWVATARKPPLLAADWTAASEAARPTERGRVTPGNTTVLRTGSRGTRAGTSSRSPPISIAVVFGLLTLPPTLDPDPRGSNGLKEKGPPPGAGSGPCETSAAGSVLELVVVQRVEAGDPLDHVDQRSGLRVVLQLALQGDVPVLDGHLELAPRL